MYELGLGVLQDYAEALSWYRLAAEQGNAPAQHNLARMYENGRGVSQDFVRAYAWFNVASVPGDENFGLIPEAARKARDALLPKMSSKQVANGQRLSHELVVRIREGEPVE